MLSNKPTPKARGFSLVEVLLVLVVGMILVAMAVPLVQSSLQNYRFRAAVSNVTWSIQAARYQAIMRGYPHRITFNAANRTYQVASRPPGAAGFTNLTNPIPLVGTGVTLSQDTTLEFRPNGLVVATAGAMNLSVSSSYTGNYKTVTVSSYGNVTVQ